MRTVVLWLCAVSLRAEYLNLVATADGRTVYFQASASPYATAWYSVRTTETGLVTERLANHIADVDDSGTVVGYAQFRERYCSTIGSRCSEQLSCMAEYSIVGVAGTVAGVRQRTFPRLSAEGSLVWMEQDRGCVSATFGAPAPLNGLYETAGMRLVAAANGAKAASRRLGRRIIVDDGRVLTLAGAQMQWLSAGGAQVIRHVNGAFEAVTDAKGENVVYVEEEVGELHWITGGEDFRLGLRGSTPALSKDGLTLSYLDEEGRLVRYDALTNTAHWLGEEIYRLFVAGEGWVFAVNAIGQIVRVDGATGQRVVWQEAFASFEAFDAPLVPYSALCANACYFELPGRPIFLSSVVRTLRFRGRWLDLPGLRATVNQVDVPVAAQSGNEGAIEVPVLPAGEHTLVFYQPGHAVRFETIVRVN